MFFLHLMRQLCGKRFFFITATAIPFALYQMLEPAFMSYGSCIQGDALGVTFPPLFMTALALSETDVFTVLMPIALLADGARVFKNDYASLFATRRYTPARVSLAFVGAALAAAAVFFLVVTGTLFIACTIMCTGSFDVEYIRSFATEYKPLLESGAAGSLGLVALQSLVCLGIAASTAAIALAAPSPQIAMMLWPVLWALQQYTDFGTALLSVQLPGAWSAYHFTNFMLGLFTQNESLLQTYLWSQALVSLGLTIACIGMAALFHGCIARERRLLPWQKHSA